MWTSRSTGGIRHGTADRCCCSEFTHWVYRNSVPGAATGDRQVSIDYPVRVEHYVYC